MTKTSVLWFRRDLRLADHPAARAAAAEGRPVVALYVIDPAFARSGVPRRAFLAAALRSLDERLGGRLVVREGHPAEVVPALAAEVGASSVHVTRDHGPYGRRRDAAVAEALRGHGARLVGSSTNYAVAPGTVKKQDGGEYRVFTPFRRAWTQVGWEAPDGLVEADWFDGRTIPRAPIPGTSPDGVLLPEASEVAQHERWHEFLGDVDRYADRRDLMADDGTSRLSAALRWGLLHPRQLLAELGDDRGAEVFASELCWREFYAEVLFQRPESAWRNLDARMDAMPVDDGPDASRRLARWATGQTGFPVVDAAMRQLAATGWMHNRARMIVASFLVKDLHLPWQWGAAHFLRHLVDGDLASNQHGWQWCAGSGTDAAPYFRVFNPTSQAERFDPDGEYVRRWVPELRGIPGAAVHRPGTLRPLDYPEPMVDHAAEREEALRRYRSLPPRA